MGEKAILFDTSKCMACRACQVACKQWWELPAAATSNRGTYENPPHLTEDTWNRIRFSETGQPGSIRWLFTRQACMHCTTAVCVWVCPTYARAYHELGYVTIDPERCIGCGRCTSYCPFEVPELGRHDVSRRIAVELGAPRQTTYSCVFCRDRVEEGKAPACVTTCPPGALRFGERTDLLKQGRARVDTLKSGLPGARLYGENELGGLHVLYVLTDEPGVHDLPGNPRRGSYPEFDEDTFPEWYIQAITQGKLPVFPAGARPEWYMQPNLKPSPSRREPEVVAAASARAGAGWGAQALLGWFVFGAIGGAAAWWVMGRKTRLEETKGKDRPG